MHTRFGGGESPSVVGVSGRINSGHNLFNYVFRANIRTTFHYCVLYNLPIVIVVIIVLLTFTFVKALLAILLAILDAI